MVAKKKPVTRTLKVGVKKKLNGSTPVKVVQDHRNGMVTVDIAGYYQVVSKKHLK